MKIKKHKPSIIGEYGISFDMYRTVVALEDILPAYCKIKKMVVDIN